MQWLMLFRYLSLFFLCNKKNQTLEEVGYVKEQPFNNEAQNYYLQLWLISHKKQH